MNSEILTWAIVLPMIGSFLVVVLDKASYRIKAAFSLLIATIPFVLLLFVASSVSENESIVVRSGWLADYGVSLVFYADPLAIFFALIASFFGMIAMLYSFGDMMHEEGATRYYALMLLFSSSMIGLVMAGNFFVLYAFWELVGLCSFSLIGFYKEKLESNRASFKAFFMTRALGICLLLGGIVLFTLTGSFDIPVVFERLRATQSSGMLTVVLVLFLLAAIAKSSQIPFLWLPDATVAPSAVTSYLHAAAMVKVGVYLIARAYPMIELINQGPYLSFLVATIGAATLTLCSMAAWSQYDIKRVVAFSTCAQIGYMFLGIGIGTGFGAIGGIFHLLNHAVFKALLFLCAGCLIYTTGTKNLNEMGGLAKKMPLVATAMIIGSFSVVGIPPFNGFASKLIIYEATLQRGMNLGGVLGSAYTFYCALALFSSAVTFAYYMRLINSAFFGRAPENLKDIKEVPLSMQIPLVILSILCLVFGIFPQQILGVFVDPAVSAFTGQPVSELNNSVTTLGFRTGIGSYEATGLTLMIIASTLVGVIIYKTTSRARPSESKSKYGVFMGGEADVPYIDVQRTRVGAKTFTYAAERTFGELYNFMWVGKLDQLYDGLAQAVQRLCDSFSRGVATRLGIATSVIAILASFLISPNFPGVLLMIIGTIAAISQKNVRHLFICAISAQIGWVVLEAAFDYPKGISEALFYVMNIIVFGLLVGISLRSVARRIGTSNISDLRGLSKKMPIAAIGFIIGGLSMSGMPPFGGWIDEFYFIKSTLEAGHVELTVIGIVISILTLAYVLETFNRIFLGELPRKFEDLKGSSAIEVVLIIVLIIITVLIGIAPQLFMSRITELVGLMFP